MAKKILLVEDNQDICDLYKIVFESKGYEIQICNNGINAVSMLDTFKPDLVLLDIMMPFVSGFDFLVNIKKKEDTDVIVVVNSNLSQDSDVEKAKELGADDYFKKADYTPQEIVEKVDAMLKIKESQS